ncbi:hypothetical protein ACSNOK_17600 [Streptomyces sp. URMC 126]|uniref:hypothetical protein n=1 Tax=Streptomyces sp. URMC 126 TaxID=3423401 RepID=UPI003F1B1EB4
MNVQRALAALGFTAAISLTTASPASAGGIGDVLSPAFGTNCANQHNGIHSNGATTRGTGTASNNVLGLPLGGALNQCGGADLPLPVGQVTRVDQATQRLGFHPQYEVADHPFEAISGDSANPTQTVWFT